MRKCTAPQDGVMWVAFYQLHFSFEFSGGGLAPEPSPKARRLHFSFEFSATAA